MLLMGKSTISMAIFNCYVSSPEGNIEGDSMDVSGQKLLEIPGGEARES